MSKKSVNLEGEDKAGFKHAKRATTDLFLTDGLYIVLEPTDDPAHEEEDPDEQDPACHNHAADLLTSGQHSRHSFTSYVFLYLF